MNWSVEGMMAIGVLGVMVLFVAAVIFDYKVHRKNAAHANLKAYRPNLRIWGIGFFAGAGLFILSLFAHTLQKIAACPRLPGDNLWLHFAPAIFLVVVIGLLTWGLVSLCQPE